MAALTAPQRLAVRALWAADISNRREAFLLSKPDLDAAIAAADTWVDSNAAAYNAALPLAARNGLSPAQKSELLLYVIRKRFLG